MRYLVTASSGFDGKVYTHVERSEHRSPRAAAKKATEFWKEKTVGLVILFDRETNTSTHWRK